MRIHTYTALVEVPPHHANVFNSRSDYDCLSAFVYSVSAFIASVPGKETYTSQGNVTADPKTPEDLSQIHNRGKGENNYLAFVEWSSLAQTDTPVL